MNPHNSQSGNNDNINKPVSWKPGSKVSNSSSFGSNDDNDDMKYAPKDSVPTPNINVDPVDILKQKRQERISGDKDAPEKNISHEVEKPVKMDSHPHFKETLAPEEEEETMSEENEEEKSTGKNAESIPEKKSSSIPFYVIMIILLAMIGYGAHLLIEQNKNRIDPYADLRDEHKVKLEELHQAEENALRMEHLALNKARLKLSQRKVADASLLLNKQDEQQAALIQQIHATKEEMVAYFKRYRAVTQKQARGLYLDDLVTRSGRQFHEVTITRCNDKQISITYAAGVVSIPISDLPAPLLDRLAYTNPFADIEASIKATNEALKRAAGPPSPRKPEADRTTAAPARPPVRNPPPASPDNEPSVQPVEENHLDETPDEDIPPLPPEL